MKIFEITTKNKNYNKTMVFAKSNKEAGDIFKQKFPKSKILDINYYDKLPKKQAIKKYDNFNLIK
jgi:hypothetical protein